MGGKTLEKSPDQWSANEAMGFKAGKTQYQMNTPGGLLTLASLANPMTAGLIGAQELSSQYQTQKQTRQLRGEYEERGQTEGAMAQQGAISSGLGGGGIQSMAGVQAYNRVLAQYSALRQALEQQRIAQQMQLYGSIAQTAASFYSPGAGAAAGVGGSASGGGQQGPPMPYNFYGS